MENAKSKFATPKVNLQLLHLSAAIPGGLPWRYMGGIALDLLTFVAKFWSGTGALDCFCTSEARYMGKVPWDL